ncbi:MAG: UDP-3-O-(3-hydroxymyristoyl)glucosamine N-acyltransferase [Proteobacteria bacterium]|nr:UDP-3-O-(3-hydroxymyristoyl)glucosamine N-acyltransferase [Pseudomonadota bacterium]
MADPRFFQRHGPFKLSELAELSGAELAPEADPDRMVQDVAPLDAAGADDISFLDNRKFLARFRASKAGACVVSPRDQGDAPGQMHLLHSSTPYRAYGLIARSFYPAPVAAPRRSERATIDATAKVAADCTVEAGAVIGPDAEIGPRGHIGPNVTIGAGVVLGADCRVYASASLSHCLAGDRVTIREGARIGPEGFGFALDPGGHVTIPQLGRVMIGDDVDIGANTTIDRGAGSDTVIGAGCRIDNLVQIGHNVVLGRGCAIAAQAGMAGSARLGDFVMVGGQAGISGHLTIGDGAQIAGQSGVITDVPAGAKFGGYPATPVRDWHRRTIALSRLAKRKGKSDG